MQDHEENHSNVEVFLDSHFLSSIVSLIHSLRGSSNVFIVMVKVYLTHTSILLCFDYVQNSVPFIKLEDKDDIPKLSDQDVYNGINDWHWSHL
jgi:3-dehydroquinate dehydratase